jgi:tetraacyldisaccharide 4'-kinase
LITPSDFQSIVSGRRRGVRAALMRWGLRAAEAPYTLAVGWRNWRFDAGHAAVTRADVPVVSVGNLTWGGTGKTPMVEWLARWFTAQQVRVTIVSRGYRGVDGQDNDEARELKQKLPDVPHLQNPDRVSAARAEVGELASELIVLDDGFQHRRLARDLDIVLLDALEPFGYNHLVPRGTLREPLSGLARADVIGLTRSDMVDEGIRQTVRQRAAQLSPRAAWIELTHQPRSLWSTTGSHLKTDHLAGKPIAAFSGIGNPTAFRRTLVACGYQIAGFREFPDHYPYGHADVEALGAWVRTLPSIKAVVCTDKDLVKIGVDHLGTVPLLALSIRIQVIRGLDEFEGRLQALLGREKRGVMNDE